MGGIDPQYPITWECAQYPVLRYQAPYVDSTGTPTTMLPGWYQYILLALDAGNFPDQGFGCQRTGAPAGPNLPLTGADGYPITDNEFMAYELLYLMQTFASMYCADYGFQKQPPQLTHGYSRIEFVFLDVFGQILGTVP